MLTIKAAIRERFHVLPTCLPHPPPLPLISECFIEPGSFYSAFVAPFSTAHVHLGSDHKLWMQSAIKKACWTVMSRSLNPVFN